MSILKDLDRIARDVEKGLANIGNDIEQDLANAAKTVKAGLDEAKAFLQKGFDEAETKIINAKVAEVEKDYKDGITLLRTLWNSVKAADATSILNDVKTMFTPGSAEAAAAAAAVQSLLTTDTLQTSYNEIEKSGFDTISAGAVGELDLVVGVASSGGLGIIITHDDHDPRLLVDFSVSGGAEEGIEGGAFLAFWQHRPSELQGGFLAVSVEGVLEAGVGLVFYFDVSLDPSFIGAAVAVSGGEEAEAGVELGFTLAFNVPQP